jgi:hypothetical protein
MDMDIASPSDDSEAYVADLLQQFAKPDEDEDEDQDSEDDILASFSRPSKKARTSKDQDVSFSIEIPVLHHLSDYELLPEQQIVRTPCPAPKPVTC